MQTLQELLERGQKNGVEGLRILNREEVLAKEKNLTTVVGALWARRQAFAGLLHGCGFCAMCSAEWR